MSKATAYKATLICLKNESHREKKYIWTDEPLPKCSECGSDMMEEEKDYPEENFNIGGKFKTGRPRTEQRKRSLKDFEKNILPTLPKKDKQHFKNKYKLKD